ncbi:MAG: phosphoenolpyruvate carboxylase [Nitrososphaerota archaeon]|jgi:phosphoenolpyruvate carboxylase|nr:phosphoenolpyruvate carboxylase [Nitrososphaerota archaeon]MDG7039644.1 phosphoenolpyruvate carboxylase [Nitrososphaerota archaeon]MDG7046209.1 phosphoenolpyruvate carboxylase [Nitrososphaerota archaeon]
MPDIRKIPATMATQHPDNATMPDWAEGRIIEGEKEIEEAYLAYSKYGCREVMWDAEGKDVDMQVLRKFFSIYGDFFKKNRIGHDIFLTYRIPNPMAESVEKKNFSEMLETIPKFNDVYRAFYGKDVPFMEVILPLTRSSDDLLRVHNYYKTVVADKEKVDIGGITVAKWLGTIDPKSIEVIPLFEDMGSLLSAGQIIGKYIDSVRPRYMRVFVARSDPALNYSMISAVLLAKLAISSFKDVEEKYGIPIYPIIGAGSLPFRGHLSPDNIYHFLEEYPGLDTVTIQSAYRYDYPYPSRSIGELNSMIPYSLKKPMDADAAAELVKIIRHVSDSYQRRVESMAGLINQISLYVPRRRARKLHIGLFGYSRRMGRVKLPRAITFVAALYSIGLPPEILGLDAVLQLKEASFNILKEYYVNYKKDLEMACKYLNPALLDDLQEAQLYNGIVRRYSLRNMMDMVKRDMDALDALGIRVGPSTNEERRHLNLTKNLLISIVDGQSEMAGREISAMGMLRRSLG